MFGFAIDMGGRTSHTAIMARSLKIPAVTGLENISHQTQTGDTIIIDGSTGVVILNPDPETIFGIGKGTRSIGNIISPFWLLASLPAVTGMARRQSESPPMSSWWMKSLLLSRTAGRYRPVSHRIPLFGQE